MRRPQAREQFAEALEVDALEDEIALQDLCERVRRGGCLGSDSMWETGPQGRLYESAPAWELHNPVRERRARAARMEAQRARLLEQREQRRVAAMELARVAQERLAAEAAIARHVALERERAEIEAAARWQQAVRERAILAHDGRDRMLAAQWRAIVAAHDWTPAETLQKWQEWLTMPVGWQL